MSSDKDIQEKTPVITESSTEISLETALTLAGNGFLTYATMRNIAKTSE